MLLDLFSLIYQDGDAPVVSRGEYLPTRRRSVPKPAATVHHDLGILAGGAAGLSAVHTTRRIHAGILQLSDGAAFAAVEAFRAAARWRDSGATAADGGLAGAGVFASGAPAIAAADDELLILGD